MAKTERSLWSWSALDARRVVLLAAILGFMGILFLLRSYAATTANLLIDAESGQKVGKHTTGSEAGVNFVTLNSAVTPPPIGGVLGLDDWTYIHADNARQNTATKWGLGMGDINGDGYADIAAGPYYYLNPGTGDITAGWARKDGLNDAQLVANIDGDAYGDVIDFSGGVIWYEWDPATSALAQRARGDGPNAHQGAAWGEVLGGGKPEVVYSTNGAIYLAIIESSGITTHQLAGNTSDEGVSIADINGDGKPDVIGSDGNNAIWLENTGTAGSWPKRVVGLADNAENSGRGYTDKVAAADIDGDGKIDVLLSEEVFDGGTANTYWWKNPGGAAPENWTRSTVATQESTNSMSMADVDKDGDFDVITGELRGDKETVVWANSGAGSVWTKHVAGTGKESHGGAKVFDLDKDGDLDIVSIAYETPQDLHIWRNDNVAE